MPSGCFGDSGEPGDTTVTQLPGIIDGVAGQGSGEAEGSSQTPPEVLLGRLDDPGVLGAAPEIQNMPPVTLEGSSSRMIGTE